MTDKPLHVQVAEALGMTLVDRSTAVRISNERHVKNNDEVERSLGIRPPFNDYEHWYSGAGPYILSDSTFGLDQVPAYDTSWEATGPLIEKYKISLRHGECRMHVECRNLWCATSQDHQADDRVDAVNPLVAVCYLVIALKEAGKLP